MQALSGLCSSRKNRGLPLLSAFGGAGARCVETGSKPAIFMQHNMGLCCMNWARGGGMGRSLPFSSPDGSISTSKNLRKYTEKVCKFRMGT